jgi:protein O-GlcNAc transferase
MVILLAMVLSLRGAEAAAQLREGARELYRGNYEKAATLARQYVERHPRNPDGLVLLARAEMAQGRYRPAYQQLRKALQVDPDNIDVFYYLQQVCQDLSQNEYQILLALTPDSARAHQFLGESYRSEGNTVRALEEYQAALQGNPRSVEVLNALGDLELARFRPQEAISYFSRATKIDPRDVRALSGLGAAHVARQEIDRAIEYFRRAMALEPQSGGLHVGLGNALLRAGKPQEAAKEFKVALALKPTLRQAYTQLARAYQLLGQPQQAQDALKRSSELSRRETEAVERQLNDKDSVLLPSEADPERPSPEQ